MSALDFSILLLVCGLAMLGFLSLLSSKPKTESEDDEMPVTNAIYDNTDSAVLLDAKMRVLELAIKHHNLIGNNQTEAIQGTARMWWDFIALKPDDDSDE